MTEQENEGQDPKKEEKTSDRGEEKQEGGSVSTENADQGQGSHQQPPPPPPPHAQPYYALPPIPNSTAVLVLGIISIVTCFCYGIPGLVCGVIALVLSKRGFDAFNENPTAYTKASYNNLNAGRICAIIGVSLSSLYLLYFIFLIAMYGSFFMSAAPWEELENLD